MRIAIIGAGLAGLACAHECERQGVVPDVFERYEMVGWIWPSVNVQLEVFTNMFGKDILQHLRTEYGLKYQPLGDLTNIILKSSHKEARIDGKLGYVSLRGKDPRSLENNLLRDLTATPVHLNRPAGYKELSRKYDCVVVADGKDIAARELGVWEECGRVYIYAGVALGSFVPGTATIYFNTAYAGTGYARVSPFDATKAMVALYVIGPNYNESDLPRLFTKFLEKEGLSKLEFFYKLVPPVFSTGRVNRFRVGNVLLAGRAAGLVERVMGEGSVSSLVSGVMAARAAIKGEDYDSRVLWLQERIENISAFRNIIDKFTNDDFDRVVGFLGTPGIKQAIYNSGIGFVDLAGRLVRALSLQ